MIKITALIEETTSKSELTSEHGLSMYIETDKHKILFDAGASDEFAKNAKKMGIDISKIDIAFLSHGHYDHGGGLSKFISLNDKAKIYANEHVFGEYWAKDGRYVGIDRKLKASGRFVLLGDKADIDEELELFTFNNSVRKYPMSSYGLMKKCDGVLKDDDFLHEQYLKIYDDEGYVLISGCSHKGILNIMDWCGDAPRSVVGGFHFMKVNMDNSGKEYLYDVANTLMAYKSNFITCHCTGEEQYHYLKAHMGDRLTRISTGDTVYI